MTVHFEGYASKYDVTVDRNNPLQINGRFAMYQSISCRPNTLLHELRIGDFVFVKVGTEWQRHKIIKWDTTRNESQSGQFQLNVAGRKRWYHPDDTNHVSKKRKRNDDAYLSAEHRSYSLVKRRRMDRGHHVEPQYDRHRVFKGEGQLNERSRYNMNGASQRRVYKERETTKSDALANGFLVGIKSDVDEWCVDEVIEWFEAKGFAMEMQKLKYRFHVMRIDGVAFLQLTSGDLFDLGINALSDRKALLKLRDDEFPRKR